MKNFLNGLAAGLGIAGSVMVLSNQSSPNYILIGLSAVIFIITDSFSFVESFNESSEVEEVFESEHDSPRNVVYLSDHRVSSE